MTHPANRFYTTNDLQDLPTLSTGQVDNLKVQTEDTRVWLCRSGKADGMPYDNQISIERLVDGRWITTDTYPGGPYTNDQ